MRKLIVLVFLFMFVFTYNAQTINTKLYNYFDGMPSDDLTYVCYSKQAGIELCSRKGIIQFDGNRFYLKDSTQQKILNAYFIKNTLYYEDGIALRKKSYSNNGKVEIVQSKNYMDEDPNNDHFENLFIDSKERIWCSDFNNIKYLYNKKTVFFPVFPDNKDLNIDIHFVEKSSNEIWVFTPNGLYEWNESNNLLLASANKNLNKLQVTAVAKNDNQLIIATKQGELHFYNLAENKIVKTIKTPASVVLQQLVLSNDNLYGISANEIFKIQNNQFVSVFASQNFNIKHFIVNEKTNNFWAATSKGLLQLHLPKKGLTFLNFPAEFSKNGNFILDVIEPVHNEFWVLTSHNQVLQYKNQHWRLIEQFPENLIIKSFTHHKDIYVTTTHGIFKWKDNVFQKLNLDGFVADEDIVKSIVIHKELWILSASSEIVRYNLQTNKKIKSNFKNTVDFWKQNKWNDLTVDHTKNVWLVGWMPKGFGICKYDENQQMFIDISHKSFNNHRDLFVGDYYNRIYTDNKNNVLFSAYGGFSIGKNTGKLTKKVDVHSYPIDDTYVTGLMQDTAENVFFATNAGLHVYLKSKGKVVKLNTTDGLTSNTLQYAFKKASNNRLLLGGENQLTVVNYSNLLQSPLQNTIKVTKLLINGTPYPDTKKLILNYKQNNITLQFSTFSYLEANKIFYEYSVNNNEWISLGNQAELVFNHLSPGSYHIKIRATDHLQNQLEKQLHYSIKINPPFTQSLLFYALLGIFAIVLVYGLFRYSLYRKMKEKKYELQVKDAEMRMLRAQMNPHFMFNTLNSINSYIIQHKTADASKYLTSFSKLMRNILESSKQQWITLAQEVKTTELYLQLEAVRLENSFTYEIVVDNDIDETDVFVPPLIVQPFAENAIWHGLRHKANGNGKLYVRFILENKDKLRIEIEDNGIGREGSVILKTAKKRTSYGVKITEERLVKLNTANYLEILDLYDSTNKPAGTKVILHLNLEEDD